MILVWFEIGLLMVTALNTASVACSMRAQAFYRAAILDYQRGEFSWADWHKVNGDSWMARARISPFVWLFLQLNRSRD